MCAQQRFDLLPHLRVILARLAHVALTFRSGAHFERLLEDFLDALLNHHRFRTRTPPCGSNGRCPYFTVKRYVTGTEDPAVVAECGGSTPGLELDSAPRTRGCRA